MSEIAIDPAAPLDFIFVYGTLMRGESRHHFLEPGRIKSIALASIAGKLFDLGEYPGMKLSSDSAARVLGELIELEAFDKIMARLDDEEGPEYRRELVRVSPLDGATRMAWTYVFTPEVDGLPRIGSGDWRAR